jgi:putative transcriptional regulator
MKVTIELGKLLESKGLSQSEFGRRTGIHQPMIHKMCKNNVSRFSLDSLAAICKELNCEISDILKLKKEPSD